MKTAGFLLLLFCLAFPSQAQKRFHSDTIESPYGLKYVFLKKGLGPLPKENAKISVRYKGWLPDGSVFDSTEKGKHFKFKLGNGEVIPGWDEAFAYLPLGSVAKLFLRPEQAYGIHGFMESGEDEYLIPPNSPLIFEVELLKID